MAEQLTIPQEMIDVAGIGVCLEMGYEPSFRPQREHAEQLGRSVTPEGQVRTPGTRQ